MSDYRLDPNDNINVSEILDDLEHYHPRRHGWTWRTPAPGLKLGQFTYEDCSEPLKSSVPLPPAHYFGDIDPQPLPTITTEIASGRFEDDIRRMRLAAHHGADTGVHARRVAAAGQHTDAFHCVFHIVRPHFLRVMPCMVGHIVPYVWSVCKSFPPAGGNFCLYRPAVLWYYHSRKE